MFRFRAFLAVLVLLVNVGQVESAPMQWPVGGKGNGDHSNLLSPAGRVSQTNIKIGADTSFSEGTA